MKKESNNSVSALFIAISALRSVAATVAVALAASLFVVTAELAIFIKFLKGMGT